MHIRVQGQATGLGRSVVRAAAVVAIVAAMIVGLAPASAGQDASSGNENLFLDVTEGPHKPAIDVLGELGVFEGTLCGDETFCPIKPIKRSDAAVWLIRALEDDDPPAISRSSFTDVDDNAWWAPFVERLAELEITMGCRQQPLRYCPDRSVTRGQMASFLVRALDLEPDDPAGFTDIEGDPHTDNINALFAAGITIGCRQDPLRYCPDRSVTRGQMASLLARALGLVRVPAATVDGTSSGSQDGEIVSAGRQHSCGVRTDGAAHMLGIRTNTARPTPQRDSSALCPPAKPIRAACAPTAQPHAGDRTNTARPTPQRDTSCRYPPAKPIRAACAPTARPHAGDRTNTARPTPQRGTSCRYPPEKPIRAACAPTARPHAGDRTNTARPRPQRDSSALCPLAMSTRVACAPTARPHAGGHRNSVAMPLSIPRGSSCLYPPAPCMRAVCATMARPHAGAWTAMVRLMLPWGSSCLYPPAPFSRAVCAPVARPHAGDRTITVRLTPQTQSSVPRRASFSTR